LAGSALVALIALFPWKRGFAPFAALRSKISFFFPRRVPPPMRSLALLNGCFRTSIGKARFFFILSTPLFSPPFLSSPFCLREDFFLPLLSNFARLCLEKLAAMRSPETEWTPTHSFLGSFFDWVLFFSWTFGPERGFSLNPGARWVEGGRPSIWGRPPSLSEFSFLFRRSFLWSNVFSCKS